MVIILSDADFSEPVTIYPMVRDANIKDSSYEPYVDDLQTQVSAIEKAVNSLEKAGYFVGLYMSKSHLETYISEEIRNKYAIWVAHYDVPQTSYSGQFGIWQKSDTGSISGISGNVDLEECYCDYFTLIQNAGLNGFAKITTAPNPEPEQKQEKYFFVGMDGKTYSGILTENL